MHPVNYPSASQLGGFFLPNAVSVHTGVWSIQEARDMGAGCRGEFQMGLVLRLKQGVLQMTGLDAHVPMQLHTGGKGLFPPLRSTLPPCLFGQSRFPSPLVTCYFKAWYGQLRFRNPHLSPIQYAQTELIGHYLLSRLSNGLLGRE